jgi:hypothetical protein
MLIDTSFDFRTDAYGKGPDTYSFTLCRYHKLLWSRVLPSGALFDLEVSRRDGVCSLYHRSELGEFFLTSDSITHTYTRWSALKRITELFSEVENEAFRTLGYTIGGMLVFPGNRVDGKQTINGARGCHWKIKDRFDLTLECIRRHYIGQRSPLEDALNRYGDFFALFEDFRGYVEFFLLQDLVVDDYSRVTFLMPFDDFRTSPVPGDVDSYREYRRLTIQFLKARNRRIDRYAASYRGTRDVGPIQPIMRASISTQATPNAVGGAAVVAAAVASAPRSARTEMTEAQALEIAKAKYGPDAMVWTTTHDKNGVAYKSPRYRIGYPAYPGERRFTEVHPEGVRRFKGVGGSWAEAVDSLKACTPREAPKLAEPKPTPTRKAATTNNAEFQAAVAAAVAEQKDEARGPSPEVEAVYSAKRYSIPHIQVEAPKPEPPTLVEVEQSEPEIFIASDVSSQQARTRRAGMTEPQQEKPFEKPKSRTYERLKCTPIMLYPDSQDDREEIQAAAKADNRSVSNYILTLVLKHLRGGNDAW